MSRDTHNIGFDLEDLFELQEGSSSYGDVTYTQDEFEALMQNLQPEAKNTNNSEQSLNDLYSSPMMAINQNHVTEEVDFYPGWDESNQILFTSNKVSEECADNHKQQSEEFVDEFNEKALPPNTENSELNLGIIAMVNHDLGVSSGLNNVCSKIPSFKVLNPNIVSLNYLEKPIDCFRCPKIEYGDYTGTILETRCYKDVIHILKSDPNKSVGSPSCGSTRLKHLRLIEDIKQSISNIVYIQNKEFKKEKPYEPQYFRFECKEPNEKNKTGRSKSSKKSSILDTVLRQSGSGLCPYCKEVKFLPFKNSSYLSHLTLEHGIYSNNYLVPEPIKYGQYYLQDFGKTGSNKLMRRKSLTQTQSSNKRIIDAIICPICDSVCQVQCWKTKENILLKYYRHVKESHNHSTLHANQGQGIIPIKPRKRTVRVYEPDQELEFLESVRMGLPSNSLYNL